MGITVAVTGPTGEIGVSAVTALEREPAVDKIVAMARRPFTPPTRGWVEWLHVARASVVMDTRKAQRHLGWRPTHSSAETLASLAKAV